MSLGHLPAGDGLVEDALGVGLTLLRRLQRRVHKDYVDAVAGANIGDASAHHPGAHDQRLGRLVDGVTLGSCTTLGDVLQVEEESLRHVLGDLAGGETCEIASLDLFGCREVDLGTFDRGGHDGERCGHRCALDLLAQIGGECREHHGESGVARRTSGHLVARRIPRLHRLGVGHNPRLGHGQHLFGRRCDLINETLRECVGRFASLTLEEHLHECLLQAKHARRAYDTTRAGKQA